MRRGQQHAHDIEAVGYNSMVQVLDASAADLNKRSRDATVAKAACAAGVEHGFVEVKEMRDMLSTVRSEQAELGVKTIKSPQSQTMEKFVDDKAHSSECIVGEPRHVPYLLLREDKAISPSGSLVDRGRDSDDYHDEFGFGGLPAEAKKIRYTIPLKICLAADGRNLQGVAVNDKVASLREDRYLAERKAREEIKIRNDMTRKKTGAR